MTPSVAPAYPAELEGHIELSDRTRLRVRALRRCEEAPLRDLYAGLSPRSRYLRFFSAMPALPDSLMRLLACVDYRQRLAIVAVREGGDTADVVALANFGAVDDSSAEVGLVVRDDWQRRGVGTALATKLMDAAEARGFHRFIGHVLLGNVGIRRLLKKVGTVLSWTTSEGVTELTFVRRVSDPQ
jgi:RimJ/RimL family protein N-acetyltransferase